MSDDPQNLSFASDRLPWQRSLRWEKPTLDKRRLAWGVLLGIVLTAIELIGFGLGMRHQIAKEARPAPTESVEVFLIPQADILPAPPDVEPPAKQQATTVPRATARRSERAPRVTARVEETPPAPVPHLYDPDGRLRLPDGIAPRAEEEIGFSSHVAVPQGDPFARRNPVPYEPTKFESVWAPSRETLGGEIVRKTTFSHTWRTPWGTQIQCGISLLAVIGGCGWGFAPTATIEELKAMRADPPVLKHPEVLDSTPSGVVTDEPPKTPPPLLLSLPTDPGSVDSGP